ncbi:hypothetical protein [Cellulomonas xiejunii]|uniref:hypothetical protein n=1 Tax=Cellulomonas xiejunii TaxID=2968083 RepID=UPI001D0EE73A|nr:hypothetical protein [Cellulomonas xiejunii]MCC2314293.1 hypothetical protein [Cellulomonas xiejunii]
MSSRRRTRYVVVGLLLCGVITNSLATLPALRAGALLLRLASLALVVAALLLVLLRQGEGAAEADRRERRRWAPWAVAVGAFVIGALAWATLSNVVEDAGRTGRSETDVTRPVGALGAPTVGGPATSAA